MFCAKTDKSFVTVVIKLSVQACNQFLLYYESENGFGTIMESDSY